MFNRRNVINGLVYVVYKYVYVYRVCMYVFMCNWFSWYSDMMAVVVCVCVYMYMYVCIWIWI